jgi:hypothetical protein
LPNYNGHISYFIEAAGDIYRELCLEPAYSIYIDEKRLKLRYFCNLNSGVIKEIKETRIEYPDWYDQLDSYIVKVNTLLEKTEEFDFGIYEKVELRNNKGSKSFGRKERMMKALEAILAICLFAKEEMTSEEVSKTIKSLDDMFKNKQ